MASAYVHKSSDRMLCSRHTTIEKTFSPTYCYIVHIDSNAAETKNKISIINKIVLCLRSRDRRKMCPLNLRATSQWAASFHAYHIVVICMRASLSSVYKAKDLCDGFRLPQDDFGLEYHATIKHAIVYSGRWRKSSLYLPFVCYKRWQSR